MNEEHDMKIDIYHALSDFLDVYDNHAEMVVTEAIANAIDVKATKIDIKLYESLETGSKFISFHNNGPAMNKKQFENYHVISRSSKTKGSGIGFAGIGAKVYLAAWKDTVIHSETMDNKNRFASDMYVKGGRLKYTYLSPKIKTPGTSYSVKLTNEDYQYLDKSIENIIIDTFSPAILKGLKIILDGKMIHAWKQSHELKQLITIKAKQKKFSTIMTITREDIPPNKQNIQYHVSGKIIQTKKPDWIMEIKPAYKQRIHAYVDSEPMANLLNLNKIKFKQGSHGFINDIQSRIYDFLKKRGYVDENSMQKWERTALTKFFEKLFKNPKYAFLNPEVRGGSGSIGSGSGSPTGHPNSGSIKSDNKQKSKSQNNEREHSRGGSFSFGYVGRKNDPREGWLDPISNKIILNIDHPLFIKYENNPPARNQRVGNIVTTVLIKNATVKKQMNAIEAFDLQTEILTMAKDEMW